MERLARAKSVKDRLEAQRLAAIEELRHSVQELRDLGDAITRSRRDGASAPKPQWDEESQTSNSGAVVLGGRFGLSRRELEVALLISQGLSNREIAETIRVSTHTARHHTQHVLGKLGVRSRSRAAALINDLVSQSRRQ